jgi:GR25 family glycosyltransferase involved in LPS biosynthesis
MQYRFYPQLDSYDNDVDYIRKDVNELANICSTKNNVAAFNSLGFIKNCVIDNVGDLKHPSCFKSNGGIYIKNSILNLEHNNKIRIKLLCNWCSSKTLCYEWKHMMSDPENLVWNNIEFTWEDYNIDFYIIINKPLNNSEIFIKERTIVFHMEPWCYDMTQNWGVKSWGVWSRPDPTKFLHVRTHDKYYNNAFWQLSTTYPEFKRMSIKKTKILSSICSSKYFDPGHIKRIDFLKYIDERGEVPMDIYNHDNDHKFKNYVGPHPPNFKDAGILPYKYYFMAENNVEYNFITEKIWEPIICESLCFYWGCENVLDYIDSQAIIILDLDNFEASYQIVKNAIINDEWSKRIEIIRREKQKILDYFQFFPTVERVLLHDLGMYAGITTEEVNYRKYFGKTHSNVLTDNKNVVAFVACETIRSLESILKYFNNTGIFYILKNVYIIHKGDKFEGELSSVSLKIAEFGNKVKFINYTGEAEDLVSIYSKKYPNATIYFNDGGNILEGLEQYNLIDINRLMKNEQSAINVWRKGENYIKGVIGEPKNFPDRKYEFVCINLERRIDRKEKMENLFKREGFNNYRFHKAISGIDLIVTNELVELFAGNDFASKKGVMGCALSHYGLWNELVKEGETDNEFYVIVEDDIDTTSDFKCKLNYVISNIPLNADIVYLGYTMNNNNLYSDYRKFRNNSILPSLNNLNKSMYLGGFFGYILFKSGAKKLIEYVKNNGIKHGIDYITKLDSSLIQFESAPHLITSEWVISKNDNHDSDIQTVNDNFENDIVNQMVHLDDPEIIIKSYFPFIIGKKLTNVCFIHSCYVHNLNILNSILDLINTSGLLKTIDYVFVINLGGTIVYNHDKIKVINFSSNMKLCEKPTINLMNNFAKYVTEDCNILYLHTKGTHSDSPQVTDWRNYMLYFMVEKWETCTKLLNTYTNVGVNYSAKPYKHFSGNYWWSKASYIKGKNIITSDDRHFCEWYILNDENGKQNNISLNNSEVDHYQQLYSREMYDNEDTLKKLEMICNLYA